MDTPEQKMPVIPESTVVRHADPVAKVRVVANWYRDPRVPNAPVISNSWSIYLIHPNGRKSVEMSTSAKPGYSYETLRWTEHRYILPDSALLYGDFPVVHPLQVYNFYDVVKLYSRDRFWMPGGGSDGRFWW